MLRAYHNWDFPKGICEAGESPIDAAVREEMGIAPELGRPEHHEFRWIDFDEAFDLSAPRVRIAPELGRPEHHEFRWIDFDEAFDLSAPRVRVVVQWAREIIGA
jgi:8-oxo-dGTP pyrophosphatase MutT (NUDIX family)